MKNQINSIDNDEAMEQFLDYWKVKLADVPTLDLPTDRPRPAIQSLCEKTVALEAYAHQEMPFEKLVAELQVQRDMSRNPLFQVMFILQAPNMQDMQLPNLTPSELAVTRETAKFDLGLSLKEYADGITGTIQYNTDLFNTETITRLVGHFQTLLAAIVEQPDTSIAELPLLTAAERQQLVVEWNATNTDYPQDSCIHELFEQQVAKTPQAVAVLHEGKQLTYAELNAQANQLAHHLRKLGVKPEVIVAICLERSTAMIIGMIAVLKAGGAYLPLDPAYPKERLAYMLEDSAPLVLLTRGQFEVLFSNMEKCPPMLDLSTEFPAWANEPNTNPDHNSVGLTPENLAYVIYTSGSTGNPKGGCVLHRGLQNLIPWYIKETRLSCEDTVLLVTSMAFDLTQRVTYGPLLAGARLVLASEPFDPLAIVAQIAKERVSLMNLTPSGFHALITASSKGELKGLQRVFLGGEPMQPSKLLELPTPRPEFVNNYGPTECTATATFYRVPSDLEQYHNRSVPIGRPIANARIYILDSHQHLVPIGVTGEIYIGGVPVGRGYLNQPELTAKCFVRDTFVTEADAKMYKTGDLGRWLADGTIEYIGRNDFQIKIRGFRIELGEIEAVLRQHPQLREVVVNVYDPVPEDKRLVAYLVSEGTSAPTHVELRDFLKINLPEFMIPSAFMFLDALPLTPNGKLNRKALPLPDSSLQIMDAGFVAPRSPVEKLLAELWCSILKVDQVGIHDNFFELGGHSLLAVELIVDVNKRFNIDLPLGAFYQSPTIEELGKIITSGEQQPSWYSLVPIQPQGSRPPLFAIHTITLQDLPRYLGKDQPLYFLRYGMAAEISDRPVRLPQFEELASHYIKELQQVQAHGPYYLIGLSFGGIIAYEMACQLLANGHQVNLVGLLDTYLTREKHRLPYHRIIYNFLSLGPSELLAMIKRRINNLITPDKYGTDFWPHFYTLAPDRACGKNYQPKMYNGDHVTLFQGDELETKLFRYTPSKQAWKEFLGDKLEVQQVPGDHVNICKEPHAKTLATKMIACMDKAMRDGANK